MLQILKSTKKQTKYGQLCVVWCDHRSQKQRKKEREAWQYWSKRQYHLKYRQRPLKAHIVAWLHSRFVKTNWWTTEGRKDYLVMDHSAALKKKKKRVTKNLSFWTKRQREKKYSLDRTQRTIILHILWSKLQLKFPYTCSQQHMA